MSQTSDSTITVIVPTLAVFERAALLEHAVESVLDQRGVRAFPLVVVNGPSASSDLVRSLAARPQVRVIRLQDASLRAALRAGREAVDSPFFAELDDDDLLLPDALRMRLALLSETPEIDAVVSNGIIRDDGTDQPAIPDAMLTAAEPLGALAAGNWLCPGAALFRSEAVRSELFTHMPVYLEWTYLAVRLAQNYRLAFLQEKTFIHHTNTPGSIWKSDVCKLGIPAAFDRLLELDLPPHLRKTFLRRRTTAANVAARTHLRADRIRDAWIWHARCLRSVGGWRHFRFTRELILAHLIRVLARP